MFAAIVTTAHPAAPPVLKSKPLLRGHFHQAAFFVFLGAGGMLVARAEPGLARGTSLTYVIGVTVLFAISALYHRPTWSERARRQMRKLDHAGIFIQIAASCAPLCLLVLGGEAGKHLYMLILGGSIAGLLQSLFWVDAPKWVPTALGLAVGSLFVPFLSQLRAIIDPASYWLLVGGGIAYAIGAVIYAVKRPDPWPRVFGYHEIFHVLVVLAAGMHFVLIYRMLGRA
jgi:hemolysin III